MALTDGSGSGGFGAQSQTVGADQTPTANPQGGLGLAPAAYVALGTAAAGLIQGIMAQRNAKKSREFSGDQAEIARQEAAKARQEAAEARQRAMVQGAIGNIGSRALQGAQGQGSALSGLANLFGGI